MASLLNYVRTIRRCSSIPCLPLLRILRVLMEGVLLGQKNSSRLDLLASMIAETLDVQWSLLVAKASSKMHQLRGGLSVLVGG
jgi:hypothetical protein